MKICHINMFYLPTFGGVEQVMYELAKRQVKEGHEIHVICCDSDKNKRIEKKEEIIEGVHVHRLPYWFRLSLSTFIWPSLLWKLGKYIKKYKFDIIHTHVSGHMYVLIAGIICKLKRVKHIHTTHCPWTDKYRPLIIKLLLPFTYLISNRIAFKLIDKIVSITPWEIDDFLKKWVGGEKIVVIPNGMDPILFKRVKNNKFKEKRKIKGKIVLFFGRLNPTKGPDKLALAGREILKERDDVNFVFIGPDEGVKDTVKEIIAGQDNMYLFEPIRDKEKIVEMYQAADIYVLPSYREGLPLTLFEAFASGLPVIASPVNGIPYEMKEPDNGYFVNYGDIEKLKERILFVLDNPKIAQRISRKNREKARSYTWDKIGERYMEEYRKLLRKK